MSVTFATRDGTHLGVDSLLRRLPRRGQLTLFAISEIIIEADGRIMLMSHNDNGHLPPEMKTLS